MSPTWPGAGFVPKGDVAVTSAPAAVVNSTVGRYSGPVPTKLFQVLTRTRVRGRRMAPGSLVSKPTIVPGPRRS